MSSLLNYLYAQLRRYTNFKSEVSSLSSKIGRSIEPLNNSVDSLNQNYKIDDLIADNNEIKSNVSVIQNVTSTLDGSVMSDIDWHIEDLNRRIEEELRRIAEEQNDD